MPARADAATRVPVATPRTVDATLDRALAAARAARGASVADLARFVRFPSVSAQPDRAGDVTACARWLAAHLARIGLHGARLIATPRHPVVVAHWLGAGPDRPTLLVYGHYDVQPVEPRSAWALPPFAGIVRDGMLHGRGAADDKGQLFAHVAAIAAWLRSSGALPVNVACVFEGEEEIGSPHLGAVLGAHPPVRAATAAVVSDTLMRGPGRPALTFALRGKLGLEIRVEGPAAELHAGTYGGAVGNPLEALCAMLASLHDATGRVRIDDGDGDLRARSAAAIAYDRRVGPSDREILSAAGLRDGTDASTVTPPMASLYERTTTRPALTVTGLHGGYTGPGGKAVIPARAMARLDIRLVPDQQPDRVALAVRRHLARRLPTGMRLDVRTTDAGPATVIDPQDPAIRAAGRALAAAFGREPVLLRAGGSIPIVSLLTGRMQIPTVLMGFGLAEDARHAPNERFALDRFFRGTEASVRFLAELARG